MYWFIKCITTDYFNFSGRARRREYWIFSLVCFILEIIFFLLQLFSEPSGTIIDIVPTVIDLALFIPSLAVSIRRLHDIDRSGWWLLLIFIPLLGWLVLIIFALLDSTPGMNRFGKNPKRL